MHPDLMDAYLAAKYPDCDDRRAMALWGRPARPDDLRYRTQCAPCDPPRPGLCMVQLLGYGDRWFLARE
jgi:hypothetical protein